MHVSSHPMKILAFLHGTMIMHASATGKTRVERVRQVQEREESVRNFASYIPVAHAVEKLETWSQQGAEIVYLSSHKKIAHVQEDLEVLQRCSFPVGQIVFRQPGETYQQVVERVLPDVLIEDDCESIGGETEMISPHLQPELRENMTCIVIKEFEGIDHLPDDIADLRNYQSSRSTEEGPS
jgi:uncharacterized protein YdhG (YjbR/CyaY superfamily)